MNRASYTVRTLEWWVQVQRMMVLAGAEIDDVEPAFLALVPQVLAAADPPKRPGNNPSHHLGSTQVKPDHGLGSRPDQVDDALRCATATDHRGIPVRERPRRVLGLVGRLLRPPWPVKHRIRLDVRDPERRRDGSRRHRVPRSRAAHHRDAIRARICPELREVRSLP